MALRLVGEGYSVVHGLDGLGWLRDITVSSSDPALTLTQQGSGPLLRGKDASGAVAEILNSGVLSWLTGAALEAGKYQIGRNNDATNRLQYNVPTGTKHEFSVNGSSMVVVNENGRLGIGEDFPIAPLHVKGGESGASTYGGGESIGFFERSGNAYMTLAGGTTSKVGLTMGDSTNDGLGGLFYYLSSHATLANTLEVLLGGGSKLRYSSGAFSFQEATEIDVLGGDVLFTERGDPAAPAADKAVLYARDNGSGKTQLAVRFPTGAVQVLATEP